METVVTLLINTLREDERVGTVLHLVNADVDDELSAAAGPSVAIYDHQFLLAVAIEISIVRCRSPVVLRWIWPDGANLSGGWAGYIQVSINLSVSESVPRSQIGMSLNRCNGQ